MIYEPVAFISFFFLDFILNYWGLNSFLVFVVINLPKVFMSWEKVILSPLPGLLTLDSFFHPGMKINHILLGQIG